MPFSPPKPLQPAPGDVRGATVLVVDDERAWRVMLETDLQLLGYRVILAGDAHEALRLAAAETPGVAIVDLMLPEPIDGRRLVQELRDRGAGLPVVLYSAHPDAEPGEDPDVVGFMSKSADRADLYALIPDAIRRSRAARSR